MSPQNDIVILAGFALALAGCASIETFQAAPRSLCQNDPVTLTWAATGNVKLGAAPALPETGPKPPAGSETFRPRESTRFTLSAHRLFSSETAEAEVVVAPPAREFGGLAACSASDRAITLSLPLASAQVSQALTVATVTNMNARAVIVTKDAISDAIATGKSSGAFLRQGVQGNWTLQAPLRANENCQQALASVAHRLSVRIAFACGE